MVTICGLVAIVAGLWLGILHTSEPWPSLEKTLAGYPAPLGWKAVGRPVRTGCSAQRAKFDFGCELQRAEGGPRRSRRPRPRVTRARGRRERRPPGPPRQVLSTRVTSRGPSPLAQVPDTRQAWHTVGAAVGVHVGRDSSNRSTQGDRKRPKGRSHHRCRDLPPRSPLTRGPIYCPRTPVRSTGAAMTGLGSTDHRRLGVRRIGCSARPDRCQTTPGIRNSDQLLPLVSTERWLVVSSLNVTRRGWDVGVDLVLQLELPTVALTPVRVRRQAESLGANEVRHVAEARPGCLRTPGRRDVRELRRSANRGPSSTSDFAGRGLDTTKAHGAQRSWCDHPFDSGGRSLAGCHGGRRRHSEVSRLRSSAAVGVWSSAWWCS